MDNKRYAVAIDGPSGAGKSTLAKAAAAELGILYVDTGAIYRTIGLYACRREADPHDLAAIIAMLPDIQVSMAYGEDGLQRMLLNGEDVTDVIRRPEISRWPRVVSAIPEVRAFLLEMQRELARSHSVVMDGRDIGTVVLPQAGGKDLPDGLAGDSGPAPHEGAEAAGNAAALQSGALGYPPAGLGRQPPGDGTPAAGGGRFAAGYQPFGL